MSVPLFERMQTFVGGMTQSVEPELIQPGQYALGVNLTSRKGLVKTREPFRGGGVARWDIASGTFQGCARYRLNSGDRIVYVIDGNVYIRNVATNTTYDLGVLLSTTADTCYFVQADRYFIIQDGDKSTSWADAKWPVILDGDALYDQSALRASDPEQALPKGGPMAYGHGRLFVATDYIFNGGVWTDYGRVGFMAGDIHKSYDPESVLAFKETWSLAEGGRFDLPEELGFIYQMDFQHNMLTATGQGPLLALAENGASIHMVNAPRAEWKADDNNGLDFSIIHFRDIGTISPNSIVHHNSDIYFRAKDGIRSLVQTSALATGQAGAGVLNKPISADVKDLLDKDTIASMGRISSVKYDNRIFYTTNPSDTDEGFQSLLVFDLEPTSSLHTETVPIFDGIWTGTEFLGLVTVDRTNEEKLVAFVKTKDGENKAVKLESEQYLDMIHDDDGNEVTSKIQCRLYTAAFYFETAFTYKKIQNLEAWFKNVEGEVDVTAFFRTDGYPFWTQMSSGTINSDPDGSNMRYSKLRLDVTDVDADPHFNERLDSGFAIQFCIQWTGKATLTLLKIEASGEEVSKRHILAGQDGEEDTASATTNAVALDDYAYEAI